jgi:hypothetical protein
MDNDNELSIRLGPSNLADAIEDYLKKVEVLPEEAMVESMIIPVNVDEEGLIPMVIALVDPNRVIN